LSITTESTVRFLEHAPLWAIGLALFLTLALVHELGALVGRRMGGDREPEGRGYLVSSALGLLALMLGFTFAAAQSRFDQRQDMVAQESNTMGTAYLRTQYVASPWREEMGEKLLRYALIRARFAQTYEDPSERSRNYEQQGEAQAALWAVVADEVRSNPGYSGNVPLIMAMNTMFDTADARLAAHERRLPLSVIRLLAFFMLGVATIVGVSSTEVRRNLIVSLTVLMLMTMAYCIVLDLDRPGSGTVTIRQAPLERTVEAIRKAEAARVAAPAPTPPS
jgi:hypothetical protein